MSVETLPELLDIAIAELERAEFDRDQAMADGTTMSGPQARALIEILRRCKKALEATSCTPSPNSSTDFGMEIASGFWGFSIRRA
jgi:hypothetical protein